MEQNSRETNSPKFQVREQVSVFLHLLFNAKKFAAMILRRTLYDFLRQSPRGQKQKQKFRDLEKRKYLDNQAMDLKFKGTVRKPTKFTVRKYIDDLPVYLVKFGEF